MYNIAILIIVVDCCIRATDRVTMIYIENKTLETMQIPSRYKHNLCMKLYPFQIRNEDTRVGLSTSTYLCIVMVSLTFDIRIWNANLSQETMVSNMCMSCHQNHIRNEDARVRTLNFYWTTDLKHELVQETWSPTCAWSFIKIGEWMKTLELEYRHYISIYSNGDLWPETWTCLRDICKKFPGIRIRNEAG